MWESQEERSFLGIISHLRVALFLPYQGHIVQFILQVYDLCPQISSKCSVFPYVR